MSPEPIPFAGCLLTNPELLTSSRLVFAGLPDDSQSSFQRGTALAPARIRLAYDGNCYNSCSDSGVDLAGRVFDAGDVVPGADWSSTAAAFREFVGSLIARGQIPFLVGGDHAVSVPVIEALAAFGAPVHVIQFDAHPDLYSEFEGSRTSHACVAARLLEMEHVASVTQYGIRAMNVTQETMAEAYHGRLHIHFARDLEGHLPDPVHIPAGAPVWFDVDVDAFDPAFAPGVSHPIPGGLSPRQVLNLLQSRTWNMVGMSVVEVNPTRDFNDLTAVLAARLLHEGFAQARRAR
jgi:agmatinase